MNTFLSEEEKKLHKSLCNQIELFKKHNGKMYFNSILDSIINILNESHKLGIESLNINILEPEIKEIVLKRSAELAFKEE